MITYAQRTPVLYSGTSGVNNGVPPRPYLPERATFRSVFILREEFSP